MITIIRYLVLILLAVAFVGVGITHFTNEEFFVAIVPPYLPWHRALVYISGFFEILGGLGILVPKLRRFAGWGLIALMIAVYPANIHMAMNPDQFPDMSPTALYVRLPIQFVMIAIVWWATKPPKEV
jgi:uncharacterized membrane protein